ncbi:protein bicaudal C homolog 1-A-like, partial [Seriola lalandi dorsalis]
MATTTTTEESSPVLATVAPQQPDLETSVEPGSAAKPEPSEAQCDREEKEDEEEEDAGGSSVPVQENARGQSLDPEWVEERFRIDRKKLENMLY